MDVETPDIVDAEWHVVEDVPPNPLPVAPWAVGTPVLGLPGAAMSNAGMTEAMGEGAAAGVEGAAAAGAGEGAAAGAAGAAGATAATGGIAAAAIVAVAGAKAAAHGAKATGDHVVDDLRGEPGERTPWNDPIADERQRQAREAPPALPEHQELARDSEGLALPWAS